MPHLSWVTVAVICLLLPFAQLQAASEWSPLLRATFSGDLSTLRSLLDEGRNINQRDDEGSTPLMVAASRGHIAIVRELLSRGAGVNLRNDYGWTPLMMATAGRHAEIVKLLLAKGADPEIQNRDGKSTLAIAKSVGLEHLFHAVGKAPSQQREHRLTQRQQKTLAQRQRQAPKQHQQPEAELAQQKPSQVEQLLARANQQVKALRLTLPAGDNALESYRQVLELEPGNAEAKAGLVRIAERYEQLARRRQATGELETSLEYITRGLQVLPEDETLLALQQAVQEAQTKAEQQQDEAKQQQAQAEQQLAEAERQRRQVAQLLEKAESQLAAWRLTTPSKDNAWESYQQVLALEPGNPEAKAGLVRIAERYAKLARRRQKAGELEKTQEYIARGLQVLPQDEALLALQEEVQAVQAEVEQQRAAAERRRRQVAELLRQADKQLAAQQLTEPAGNNAWESYRRVLGLAPDNTQAEAGLAEIAARYAQRARQHREAGELAASLAAVETGLQVRPQDKTLLALQEEVQQAQAEAERQRAQAERRRRQVAELLRQADKQLTAQQLTEPAGDNAWESYRQVLELAPGNGQAEAGLAEIAARYAQRARQHQEAGELEPSLTAIAKGLQVRPQDKALLALQAEVQAAQTEAKRHRQIAKLLEQAEEQMAAQQLTEPAGDNAWESYKQILFLDLGNVQAKGGLKRIAEQYAQLARQRQEAGKLEASLAAIAKGLQVRPQDKTLLSIQEEVRQAQAEAERQRRQVEELLRHADEQLAAGQLTEPAGDNAWESYQQVLVLEPENTAAQAGLQRLLGQAKQILNEKIKALNHTEQEVEVEEQAIRLSIQRTLAQEWEQYSKQAASHQ